MALKSADFRQKFRQNKSFFMVHSVRKDDRATFSLLLYQPSQLICSCFQNQQ